MNTDGEPDLKRGTDSKLLLKQETHQIIGCAFEVVNIRRAGFLEKVAQQTLSTVLAH